MIQRVIISLIAINQFLLGLLWLAMGLSVAVTPLFVMFGFWGAVNAFALLFSGTVSRITALAWHFLFIGYMFIRYVELGRISEGQKLIGWWALIDLLALVYLFKIVFGYFRNHNKPHLI